MKRGKNRMNASTALILDIESNSAETPPLNKVGNNFDLKRSDRSRYINGKVSRSERTKIVMTIKPAWFTSIAVMSPIKMPDAKEPIRFVNERKRIVPSSGKC